MSHDLSCDVQETQRLAGSEGRSERRIGDLESGIERLRNHQEMLKRKLKKQAERKQKLEVKSFAIKFYV